jgi:hypothetical protein
MYVLVKIDELHHTKQEKEVEMYINEISIRYNIRSVPTVLLMHTDEKVYCNAKYQHNGAKNYIQFLKEQYKKNAVKK